MHELETFNSQWKIAKPHIIRLLSKCEIRVLSYESNFVAIVKLGFKLHETVFRHIWVINWM